MSPRRKSRQWNKTRILEAIRALHEEGRPLSYNCVARESQDLISAANYHFGSWRVAVEAAGLDYDAHVRRKPKWTRGRIIELLQDARRRGDELSWSRVIRHPRYRAMACAAIRPRCFGSWDAALEAAGIDPASERRYESWSEKKVIERIRQRRDAGKSLSSKDLQQEDSRLFNAALKRFDSWQNALIAAGISPAKVYKRRRWSTELIVKEIQLLHSMGYDLAAPAMRRDFCGLYSAGCKYFGSWSKARKAAGITANYRRRTPGGSG
jgi:hypothetical protein